MKKPKKDWMSWQKISEWDHTLDNNEVFSLCREPEQKRNTTTKH